MPCPRPATTSSSRTQKATVSTRTTLPNPDRFTMSHFSGHKPRASPAALTRRATGATVFAGGMLLVYALFPLRSTPATREDPFLASGLPREPVAQQVEEAVRSDAVREESLGARDPPVQGCLRSVIYDKPVKTGSTAITFAIREYLKSTRRADIMCNTLKDSCFLQTERICLGTHARQSEQPSFLGHLKQSNGSTIECLKRMGYYAVTSIRDPYARRKSAYLYNKTVKGNHYAIPHTASFKEFMRRLPRCILFNDYDGLGKGCDVGISIEERVKRIVDRYDEVIELAEVARGPLYRRIVGFLERENESRKEEVEDFDESSLIEERMLYNALREKMLRAEVTDRVPC